MIDPVCAELFRNARSLSPPHSYSLSRQGTQARRWRGRAGAFWVSLKRLGGQAQAFAEGERSKEFR